MRLQGRARTEGEGRTPYSVSFCEGLLPVAMPPFPGVPAGERGLSWLCLGDVVSSKVFSLSRNLVSREQDLEKGRPEVLAQPAAVGMCFRK